MRGTDECESLKAIMYEVHGGIVYRRRHVKGGMGPRATQQFYVIVVKIEQIMFLIIIYLNICM